MTRLNLTAEAIQAEVRRMIHEGEVVSEDGTVITVPLPAPYAEGVVDEHAANWTMNVFDGIVGYEGWVYNCVLKVQARITLQT